MKFRRVHPARIPHILLILGTSLTILFLGENPLIAALTMAIGGPLASALPHNRRGPLTIELVFIAVMMLLGFLTSPVVKLAEH